MDNFLSRLVEHGEIAEGDARKLIREVLDRREKLEKERRAEREHNRAAAGVTKADLDTLNARIAELNKQIGRT